MGAMASQITSLTIVYSTVYSGTDQTKHQSSTSLAFVRGIHRWLVNSPHKWPVTRKMLPFDDVIMLWIVDERFGSFTDIGLWNRPQATGACFQNAYGILNVRALNNVYILQCMRKVFCQEFREHLEFQTKYLTHALKLTIFVQRLNLAALGLKSSYAFLRRRLVSWYQNAECHVNNANMMTAFLTIKHEPFHWIQYVDRISSRSMWIKCSWNWHGQLILSQLTRSLHSIQKKDMIRVCQWTMLSQFYIMITAVFKNYKENIWNKSSHLKDYN